MSTLILTHTQLLPMLDALPLLEPMRAGFRAHSEGQTGLVHRARSPLNAKGAALVVFPGLLPDVPAYTVKVNASFPGQAGGVQGALLLHDLATGGLLAIMDSAHLTALRTGVVGAVAADLLARPDASRVAIIGAGVQGSMQLKCLRLVRSLSHVRIFDLDPLVAHAFATRLYTQLKLPVRIASSVEEAVADADIVVTATGSRKAFLEPDMLRPGTHVTSLGSDEVGKHELTTALLASATVFCDDRRLTLEVGALGGSALPESTLRAELGEVLAGKHSGRTDPLEQTVFTSVGLPFQDLVVAWDAYQAAAEDPTLPRLPLQKREGGTPLAH